MTYYTNVINYFSLNYYLPLRINELFNKLVRVDVLSVKYFNVHDITETTFFGKKIFFKMIITCCDESPFALLLMMEELINNPFIEMNLDKILILIAIKINIIFTFY